MMNSRSNTRLFERKAVIILILVCGFLLVANLATWKANVLSPKNFQTSAIGQVIAEALPADKPSPNAKLNIDLTDLVSRLKLPAGAPPYLTTPIASSAATMGNIDEVKLTPPSLRLRGWVFIAEGTQSPEFVIAVEDGKVIGAVRVSENRPDVAKALGNKEALRTGYDGQINTLSNVTGCNITLFALTSSLTLFPMPSVCDKAKLSNH